MTIPQRSAQIWPVLALAAKNRQILTYNILARAIGMPARGLGNMLEPIQSYCLIKKLPPLTILVVQKETGLPGPGFSAVSKDIPKHQIKVFEYDWLKHGCPSPEEFAKAVKELPSNVVKSGSDK